MSLNAPAAVATYSKSANTTVTRSNPSINVSGANTQNLCKGQAYSFGASGGTCGATITWTAPTGWTLQSQSGTNATFFASTTAISGAITATATYTGGCAASTSSLNIAVLSTPPANPIFMRDPQDGYLFYHCSAWRLCPGGRINAKIFAGTQSIKFELVGTNWKFGNGSQISQGPIGGLVGSYFEGVTQDELIDAVIFPTTGSNATSGTLKITAYNCVGASQTISVNFIREMNYFCNSNLSEGTCYPRTCSCCLPTDVPNCIGGPQRQIAPQQDEYLTSNLEEEADILQLYPNPTSGQCTARFSRPFTGAINVHDLQGCIIWSQNFENIMQTDLGRQAEMLPNGLYVITSIAADGVQHHEKFIISK